MAKSELKSTAKEVGLFTGLYVLAFVAVIALIWVVAANALGMYKVFAPREEAIRRETFEQSKAYIQGTTQELENMQVEYLKSDKGHKDALASIILHRAAGIDETKLPADLRSFIQSLRERSSY